VDRVARFVERTSPENEARTLDEMFQRMTSLPSGVVGMQPEGLPAICADWDVPYGRVLAWLMADAARYGVYEKALEVASHALVAETIGIADSDSPSTQRDRLRVETRFRVAKHHAPDRYGEKLQVTNTERMEVVLEVPALELLRHVRGPVVASQESAGVEVQAAPVIIDASPQVEDEDCPI